MARIAADGESAWSSTTSTQDAGLGFWTTQDGSATKQMTIDSSGDTTMSGGLDITGALSKGSGTFTIDHPLDPENKLLQHSFVESPEMRNVYYGQVTLSDGKATVSMPDWWIPLNGENKSEYNYQLTCIGGYTQTWISKEVDSNGEFEISGNADIKVSWTLSAIRHDIYAENNRVQVELDKKESGKGSYRHPITEAMKTKNKQHKEKPEKK